MTSPRYTLNFKTLKKVHIFFYLNVWSDHEKVDPGNREVEMKDGVLNLLFLSFFIFYSLINVFFLTYC